MTLQNQDDLFFWISSIFKTFCLLEGAFHLFSLSYFLDTLKQHKNFCISKLSVYGQLESIFAMAIAYMNDYFWFSLAGGISLMASIAPKRSCLGYFLVTSCLMSFSGRHRIHLNQECYTHAAMVNGLPQETNLYIKSIFMSDNNNNNRKNTWIFGLIASLTNDINIIR